MDDTRYTRIVGKIGRNGGHSIDIVAPGNAIPLTSHRIAFVIAVSREYPELVNLYAAFALAVLREHEAVFGSSTLPLSGGI